MKPVIVLPLHDPSGLVLPHIKTITPDLKEMFSSVVIHLSLSTRLAHPGMTEWLESDPIFRIEILPPDLPLGNQFKALYSWACALFPDQVLHLCFPDRIAFALLSEHRQAFTKDINSSNQNPLPWLYQRSSLAWSTHPSNYYLAERKVTRLGEKLFGRSLDFAWCHLVINSSQLSAVLPYVHAHGLEMMAEMILPMWETIQTQDVDWLAWEDPFLLSRNASELKQDRENNPKETQKRLDYVIPMLEVLHRWKSKND